MLFHRSGNDDSVEDIGDGAVDLLMLKASAHSE